MNREQILEEERKILEAPGNARVFEKARELLDQEESLEAWREFEHLALHVLGVLPLDLMWYLDYGELPPPPPPKQGGLVHVSSIESLTRGVGEDRETFRVED